MSAEENKQIMAKNILRYMEAKGVTNKRICDDLDIKYTTFMDWIKGKTYPRIGKVEIMAHYFNCEKSDLIEDKNGQPSEIKELPDLDREIFSLIKVLPIEQKRFILAQLRILTEGR